MCPFPCLRRAILSRPPIRVGNVFNWPGIRNVRTPPIIFRGLRQALKNSTEIACLATTDRSSRAWDSSKASLSSSSASRKAAIPKRSCCETSACQNRKATAKLSASCNLRPSSTGPSSLSSIRLALIPESTPKNVGRRKPSPTISARCPACALAVIAVVIGEGGSGGALGLGVANRVYMLENAYYSVISPESCAAIIYRDSGKAPEAAASLRMTASDLLGMKLIDGIVPEPPGGAHLDAEAAISALRLTLKRRWMNFPVFPLTSSSRSVIESSAKWATSSARSSSENRFARCSICRRIL